MALGGFLLGGGHPIIARSTGAGVDNVLGHTVVLANGTVVETSATDHAELYWGTSVHFGLNSNHLHARACPRLVTHALGSAPFLKLVAVAC